MNPFSPPASQAGIHYSGHWLPVSVPRGMEGMLTLTPPPGIGLAGVRRRTTAVPTPPPSNAASSLATPSHSNSPMAISALLNPEDEDDLPRKLSTPPAHRASTTSFLPSPPPTIGDVSIPGSPKEVEQQEDEREMQDVVPVTLSPPLSAASGSRDDAPLPETKLEEMRDFDEDEDENLVVPFVRSIKLLVNLKRSAPEEYDSEETEDDTRTLKRLRREAKALSKKRAKLRKRKHKRMLSTCALPPLVDYGRISDRPQVVGLQNCGNTCYNNAAIQALFHIPKFRDFFLHREIKQDEGGYVKVQLSMGGVKTRRSVQKMKSIYLPGNVTLTNELTKLFRDMAREPTAKSRSFRTVDPERFAATVKYLWERSNQMQSDEEQDSHEFLGWVMHTVQEELAVESQPTPCRSIVNEVFGGLHLSKKTCDYCGSTSTSTSETRDVEIHVYNGETTPSTNRCSLALEECIRQEAGPNKLTDSSCLDCSRLDHRSECFEFLVMPEVLSFLVKRAVWNRSQGKHAKINKHLAVPLRGLDMTEWSNAKEEEGIEYDLCALIEHIGEGAGSGHYVCYTKCEGNWYKTNDASVRQVPETMVKKAEAYILFYERVRPAPSTTDVVDAPVDVSTETPADVPTDQNPASVQVDEHETPPSDASMIENESG